MKAYKILLLMLILVFSFNISILDYESNDIYSQLNELKRYSPWFYLLLCSVKFNNLDIISINRSLNFKK